MLETRARQSAPVAVGRRIAFPGNTQPKIRVAVGNDPAQRWKLVVRFAGRVIFEQEINSQTQPGHWKQLEIPAEELAAQEGWLVVDCQTIGGDPQCDVFWKKVEIAF